MAGLLDNQTAESYYGGNTGGYRYVSLDDIINNFMFAYVGDNKLLPHARRSDVLYHAKQAIREFSFDILKVHKKYEIQIPSSLTIAMPQDYVDRVKLFWVDSGGIERPIYEGSFTSNPNITPIQDGDGDIIFDNDEDMIEGTSVTSTRFKEFDPNNFSGLANSDIYYATNDFESGRSVIYGGRYGLSPELAQTNGYYFINESQGTISFSSNLVDKIVNIHYISDGLGTEAEMKVNKLAEKAIYSYVVYEMLSIMSGIPEYQIRRYQLKRRAEMRNAKIRLAKYNSIETTQSLKEISKPIK